MDLRVPPGLHHPRPPSRAGDRKVKVVVLVVVVVWVVVWVVVKWGIGGPDDGGVPGVYHSRSNPTATPSLRRPLPYRRPPSGPRDRPSNEKGREGIKLFIGPFYLPEKAVLHSHTHAHAYPTHHTRTYVGTNTGTDDPRSEVVFSFSELGPCRGTPRNPTSGHLTARPT